MKFKRLTFALLASICLGVLFDACSPQKKTAAEPHPFDVYFTCDTNGRIEPCGCFTGQYGGLTRVSTALSKAPEDALKFEIGNAIAGLADYNVIQYGHLLDACEAIGYDAVNLGEREAQLPAATLRDLASKSSVPLLGANILDASTREPVAGSSIIVDHGKLKVGVVGVVDPNSLKASHDPSVEISSMGEALRSAIAEFRKSKESPEVLVCLAFTNEDGMEQLAREFYEFDLILGGDVLQPSSVLGEVNRSLLLATTNQARALGEVHAAYYEATGKLETATGDVKLMRDSIRQDPEIQKFSTEYRKQIRDIILAIDKPASQDENRIPGIEPTATFLGSQSCAACHPKAFEKWSKSGHSHAFQSLVRKQSDADPSCIQCHVVGFGEPGGYTRPTSPEHLKGVGCESCHGPGSEHVRLRASAKPGEDVLVKMRPVGQGQCIQCHHGEFSRPFNWNKFWPGIEHGKE